MKKPVLGSDAVVVTGFYDVLLTLRLSCLCAYSLPLRSIVCSKYDPNRLAAQATSATNSGTAMRASGATLLGAYAVVGDDVVIA